MSLAECGAVLLARCVFHRLLGVLFGLDLEVRRAFSLPVLVNAVAALGSVCPVGFGSLLLGCMPGRFSDKIDEWM